jgi:hypothetical protein
MHPRLLAQTMRGLAPSTPAADPSGRAASPLHPVAQTL